METRRAYAKKELDVLQPVFKGELSLENGIATLKVGRHTGRGVISAVCFKPGLVAKEFEVSLYEHVEVDLHKGPEESLYFLYCLKGNIFYRSGRDSRILKIEEFQTVVMLSGGKSANRLLLGKQQDLVFNLIRINKEEYCRQYSSDEGEPGLDLGRVLGSLNPDHGHVHLGASNLEIGEYLKILSKAKYANSLTSLMQFEAICLLILARQIEQYNKEISEGYKPPGLLRKELKKIDEVTNFIRTQIEAPHSIRTLCSFSGLTPTKLQEGFKFMHGRTVSDYIRNQRLERAEFLLRTTDMNVSEVVYSIGLTSRSYFCKIFKHKYYCSPKEYKSKVSTKNKLKADRKSQILA